MHPSFTHGGPKKGNRFIVAITSSTANQQTFILFGTYTCTLANMHRGLCNCTTFKILITNLPMCRYERNLYFRSNWVTSQFTAYYWNVIHGHSSGTTRKRLIFWPTLYILFSHLYSVLTVTHHLDTLIIITLTLTLYITAACRNAHFLNMAHIMYQKSETPILQKLRTLKCVQYFMQPYLKNYRVSLAVWDYSNTFHPFHPTQVCTPCLYL